MLLPPNTLRDWLVALAILLGVFAFLTLSRQIARRRIARMETRAATPSIDTLAATLVRQTRFLFFVVLAVWAASLELTLPPHIEQGIRDLTIIAVLVQIAIWGNSLIAAGLHEYVARRSTPSGDSDGGIAASQTTVAALSVVARVVLWSMLLLIALDSLGVHVTTLIAGLGVTGIALALAVQNILGDLFAALSIVMDKPFVVGDAIGVETMSGVVEHIGLKTTRVRAHTGEQIVFSNADLLRSRIRNFRRLHERTVTLPLTLDLATPAEAAAHMPDLLRHVVAGVPGVRLSRAHVTTPTPAGIGVETVYVVESSDYGAYMDAQQAITVGLLQGLSEAGIRLASTGVTIVTPAVLPGGGGVAVPPGDPAAGDSAAIAGHAGTGTTGRFGAS